jgi:hypothetical protein
MDDSVPQSPQAIIGILVIFTRIAEKSNQFGTVGQ